MAARKSDDVNVIESMEFEFGDDCLQSVVRSGDVVIGATQACSHGIPPTQRHLPIRTTGERCGISCSQSHDVSTRHGLRTFLLHSIFDLIDDVKSSCGVPIGVRYLFRYDRFAAVK